MSSGCSPGLNLPEGRRGLSAVVAGGGGLRQSCLICMHALLGLEVQSQISGKVIFDNWEIRFSAAPARCAHNGLVGGSNPSSPTTQSDANRRFLVSEE